MFKQIKRLFWLSVTLFLVGAAFYLPLRMHLVRYNAEFHLVRKDALGWDNTYINLDKESSRWWFVMKSPNLRSYFAKHYPKVLAGKAGRSGRSLWQKLKDKSAEGYQRLRKQITRENLQKLKEQGKKTLHKIKDKAGQGYQKLKGEARELYKNATR